MGRESARTSEPCPIAERRDDARDRMRPKTAETIAPIADDPIIGLPPMAD
jgi:hypothetical protein